MDTEILKKIIAEWLQDKVFPPLVKRDAPDLVLERVSEIIAVAGPRRAGKTCYMYQLYPLTVDRSPKKTVFVFFTETGGRITESTFIEEKFFTFLRDNG